MNHRTVAVHGARGTQGAPVARTLAARGWRVDALSRSSDLAAAYRHTAAVVVQLPLEFDPATIARQVDEVLAAFSRADVGRVVFNAGMALPPVGIGVPFVDERVRLAAALPAAVAHATTVGPLFAYMENLALPSSATRLRDRGELAYPVPADFAMPWLSLDDLAAVIADVLDDPAPPVGRVVAGPDDLRGPDAAAAIAASVGQPVRWATISAAEYREMLAADLGPDVAAGIAGFYEGAPSDPLPPADHRGTTTLGQWAGQVLSCAGRRC